MDKLRYSIIIDGHDAMEIASLKDAKFHAQTATLNAKEQVEIYDSETDSVVETFYPEEIQKTKAPKRKNAKGAIFIPKIKEINAK